MDTGHLTSTTASAMVDMASRSADPGRDKTFGALFLGLCGSILLYGLALHQTYHYFRMFSTDGRVIKVWVVVVTILETIATALSVHTCYFFLITSGSEPSALASDIWTYRLIPVTQIFAVAATQLFYARRVYLLGRQYRVIVLFAFLCILTEAAFATATTVITFELASVDEFSHFVWMVAAIFGFGLGSDVLLTSTLLYVLVSSRTEFKSTRSILDTLIVYTINTGLLIGCFAILTFVLSLTNKTDLIYSGISLVAAKVYSNSFLAMLNSRVSRGTRRGFTDDFETHVMEFSPNQHRVTSASTAAFDSRQSTGRLSVVDIFKGTRGGELIHGSETAIPLDELTTVQSSEARKAPAFPV